jgi:hypothetical protein
MFKMTVKPVDGPQLKVQFAAESAKRAEVYATNRWPGARVSDIEIVTQ